MNSSSSDPLIPEPITDSDPGLAAIRVIIADDHPLVLLGICKLLEDSAKIQIVGTANTVAGLLALLGEQPCEVLICDYSFEDDPHQDGLELLKRVGRLYPEVRIVLISAHDDVVVVNQAMQSGVAGFLSKSSKEFSALPAVIEQVWRGDKYLDPSTSRTLFNHMYRNQSASLTASIQLSGRELEVLRLFAKGMTVTQIAQHSNRSLKTISAQKQKAMQKLGARNDVELINAFNKLS